MPYLELPEGRARIEHTRDDLQLKKLWLAVFCVGRQGWSKNTCAALTVQGRPHKGLLIELDSTGQNVVPVPSIRINLTSLADTACVTMKAVFSDYPNEVDFQLYADPNDRYSILSYCTQAPPMELSGQPRVNHRRVQSWTEFINRLLNRPLVLKLNERTPSGSVPGDGN